MDAPSYVRLAGEVERHLHENLLAPWFPRCVDTDLGGFRQTYDRRWQPGADGARSVVFQSRLTWVLASAARRRPEAGPAFASWARHGLDYLAEAFWDHRHGGVRFYLGNDHEKHSYGIAFALFAAAACIRSDGSDRARSFAMQLFDWWDDRAFDGDNGGYFEALGADGSPLTRPSRSRDLISVPYGLRSSNTQLHAIETLTELYRATGHPAVRTRLETVLAALEATVIRHRGHLYTTYTRDWHPVDRSLSYGHDLEALFLALDARASLGWASSTPLQALLERAVDRGLDRRHGGLYYGRKPFRLRSRKKVDWVQAEALNTFSFLAAHYPAYESICMEAFDNVWQFVFRYMVDHELGGWYGALDAGGNVLDDRKAHRWKACYHPVRALLNASDWLRGKATSTAG